MQSKFDKATYKKAPEKVLYDKAKAEQVADAMVAAGFERFTVMAFKAPDQKTYLKFTSPKLITQWERLLKIAGKSVKEVKKPSSQMGERGIFFIIEGEPTFFARLAEQARRNKELDQALGKPKGRTPQPKDIIYSPGDLATFLSKTGFKNFRVQPDKKVNEFFVIFLSAPNKQLAKMTASASLVVKPKQDPSGMNPISVRVISLSTGSQKRSSTMAKQNDDFGDFEDMEDEEEEEVTSNPPSKMSKYKGKASKDNTKATKSSKAKGKEEKPAKAAAKPLSQKAIKEQIAALTEQKEESDDDIEKRKIRRQIRKLRAQLS